MASDNVKRRLTSSCFGALTLSLAVMGGAERAGAVTTRTQFDVGGQKRSALLIEYQRLKRQPRTLIIVLRGAGGRQRTSRTDARGIGLTPLVRNAGVVIAYPDAVADRWNLGSDGADDVGFVRTLATKLVADGVADKRKIFVVGVASGGVLALRIACEGADYASGFVTAISNMPSAMQATCKIAKPVSILMINGTADPLMPFQGGTVELNNFKGDVASTEDTLKPFAAASQCSGERTKTDVPDRDPNDGSRVVDERFNGCKTNVELLRIVGGGHTLPGRPDRQNRGASVGALNNDISTPRVVWDFIRRATR